MTCTLTELKSYPWWQTTDQKSPPGNSAFLLPCLNPYSCELIWQRVQQSGWAKANSGRVWQEIICSLAGTFGVNYRNRCASPTLFTEYCTTVVASWAQGEQSLHDFYLLLMVIYIIPFTTSKSTPSIRSLESKRSLL